MAVRTGDLKTPERGTGELTTREGQPTPNPRFKAPDDALDEVVDDLETLRGRIEGARNIKPRGLHCSHCVQAFVEGRDAVVKAIDG